MIRSTNALASVGRPIAGALLVAALAAGGADAQSINPDNTNIAGIATNPTFDFEGTQWVCPEGTAVGTTSTDSPVVNVELDFGPPGECEIGFPDGVPVTVECTEAVDDPGGELNELGTARLMVTNGTTNDGVVEQLNDEFQCDVVLEYICTVSVAAQELPLSGGADHADLSNEPNPPTNPNGQIDVDLDAFATNDNSFCGPVPGGIIGFIGVYQLADDHSGLNVTFD
jgi:hypothetical protein